MHLSGGTICEPVDVPVNKRHLDMVYSHIKYSDKGFMGSVTAPERALDTVEMIKIIAGDNYIDAETGKPRTYATSLINANSPLTYDDTMLGAAKVYAENNQACIITPFILAGAMSPVTVAGTAAQSLAEALAGLTFVQLVIASSMSMQSGAPTFGTPEPALVLYIMAALARRLGVPFRSGGGLCGSKLPDAQAASEAINTMLPAALAGVNFVLHTAGWMEGGLSMGYEKFIMDVDQASMLEIMLGGVDLSENGQAMDAIREVGPGVHFLGCAHTQKNFKTAFKAGSIMPSAQTLGGKRYWPNTRRRPSTLRLTKPCSIILNNARTRCPIRWFEVYSIFRCTSLCIGIVLARGKNIRAITSIKD